MKTNGSFGSCSCTTFGRQPLVFHETTKDTSKGNMRSDVNISPSSWLENVPFGNQSNPHPPWKLNSSAQEIAHVTYFQKKHLHILLWIVGSGVAVPRSLVLTASLQTSLRYHLSLSRRLTKRRVQCLKRGETRE